MLGVGKAAVGMAEGVLSSCPTMRSALLVVPEGMAVAARELQRDFAQVDIDIRIGGHPLPDTRSLDAGQAMLDFLARADHDILLLLSGGASALADLPVHGLAQSAYFDWQERLYRMGLPIAHLNAARQRLSALKGGRLLQHLPDGISLRQLLVSDVPAGPQADEAAIVGSALAIPLAAPPELPASLDHALPAWRPLALPRPKTDIVLRNDDLLDALEAAATGMNWARQARKRLDGDAAEAGRACAAALADGPPGFYLWGGETTLAVPADAPPGGRNQHLALAAAAGIAGRDDCLLLAFGTDGRDGTTEEAGALVDGGSVERSSIEGWDAADALAACRAHEALQASGDLLHTGPTGNNLMDVVFGLKLVGPASQV